MPDSDRYLRLLKWKQEGRTNAWMAKQLGISPGAIRQALIRANHWKLATEREEMLRNPDAETAARVQLSISQDHVLARVDDLITEGLKIQAQVTRPLLERVAEVIPEMTRTMGVVLERMVIMEAAIERLERRPVSAPVAPPSSAPAAPKTGRPSESGPPPALWVWIAQECSRHLGRQGTADALRVDVNTVSRWLTGATPKSSERDELRNLLATLWARETFVDFDDVEDARGRVVAQSSAGAEV
jgi:hypothetical protein